MLYFNYSKMSSINLTAVQSRYIISIDINHIELTILLVVYKKHCILKINKYGNMQCDMIFELFKDKSASFLASIFQDMILRAKRNFFVVYYSEI